MSTEQKFDINVDEYTLGEHFIEVGDGHSVYVYDWGKEDSKTPIIFLAGGPGVGISDRYKQRFEPTKQRVIFIDQRGCGRSTPKGSLQNNTTQDSIEDIEKVAKHLELNKFIITGGSWGSCLALAYGLKYPKRVEAMTLSGIFTSTQGELDFLLSGGFGDFFPDVWEKYLERTPAEHRKNPSAYHIKKALGDLDDPETKKSAYAISELEGSLLALDDRRTAINYEDFDPDPMRIELHYLANNCFMPEGYILKNAKKLTMPIWLVQGRYDMVCPPRTAYLLDQELPNSELIFTTAGHGNDRPNYEVIRTLLLQLTKDN